MEDLLKTASEIIERWSPDLLLAQIIRRENSLLVYIGHLVERLAFFTVHGQYFTVLINVLQSVVSV